MLAREETGHNVDSRRKAAVGRKGAKKKHSPFCSPENQEVMGTDLQEVNLMRQEVDILITYYQDWVWSKLTLWFMFS